MTHARDPKDLHPLRNIYTPNKDNPNFKKNVLSRLLSFECEEIILGCDFNLVLDVQNDENGARLTTNKNSLKDVQNIINLLDLIDDWRVSNPEDTLLEEANPKFTVA